ncbi:MAG: HlyD family secretion protein [Paludibacter sp.]|jgi:HlyD family secretion protein|nr:HlyD family secretion protein [Paludibacter sp.]
MENENNIELRSEEFQEILSRPPSWIQRWGIMLIFILLAVLLAGSWFFKYPEILTATIIVSTENLPFDVVAKTSGRIDTLFVTEKQQVIKNQLLGVIENTANTNNVLKLEMMFENENARTDEGANGEMREDADSSSVLPFEPSSIQAFALSRFTAFAQLGDLQPSFSAFQKAAEDLDFFLATDYHNKKIAVVEKQKRVQQNLLNQSIKQLSLSKKQLETAQKQFKTDSTLFEKQVIAAFDFETAKNTFLQAQQTYENAKSSIENQRLAVLQYEQQIFDLQQQRAEQLSALNLAMNTAQENLKAQIKTFRQTYFLVSQIDGTATFTRYYQHNQNVTAGQTVVTIVPNEKQKIIGKISLPPARAGKVKTGQTVNVKFDDFPYQEYGMLKVPITDIALVPVLENGLRSYILEVQFPDTLTTTYHRKLAFRQQMSGTAEIITDDLRLIERLVNPVKAVFDK